MIGLTAARERAGWSLQQAADQLHLDVTSVKALEAGDFAALGAQVHARGHLRHYAQLLGLPEGTVESACAQQSAPERNTDLKRISTNRQLGARNAFRVPPGAAAVAAAVLVVLALVWWAARLPHSARAVAAPASPAAESKVPPPTTAPNP